MFRIDNTLVYFLIFTIISSALGYKIVTSAYNSFDSTYEENYVVARPSKPEKKKVVVDAPAPVAIKVFSPRPNDSVTNPYFVKGEARGSWYFEGSFEIHLIDTTGKVLAKAPAVAQGEWTTPEFVPFEATLNFDEPVAFKGTMLFIKANPSGEKSKEETFSIPVSF